MFEVGSCAVDNGIAGITGTPGCSRQPRVRAVPEAGKDLGGQKFSGSIVDAGNDQRQAVSSVAIGRASQARRSFPDSVCRSPDLPVPGRVTTDLVDLDDSGQFDQYYAERSALDFRPLRFRAGYLV